MTTSVAVFAYDGCIISGIAGPVDVFNIANTHNKVLNGENAADLFRWQIYSHHGQPVKTSSGIDMAVAGNIRDVHPVDILILPGIDHCYGSEVISQAQTFNQQFGSWLKELHRQGTTLASNCSGSFIFAEAGLLDGREATTSWWLSRHFQQRYPQVKLRQNKLVTVDERIFCSGAFTSYLHEGIQLIETFADDEIANRCARTLLLQTKSATQAPYIGLDERIDKMDDIVHQAIVWMSENMQKDIQLEQLAKDLAVSPRTFIRRFNQATGKPPKQYLQHLRINEAKRLLEHTNLGIDKITDQVGYTDVSSFRRLFKREVDLSPSEYRKRFAKQNHLS